MSMRRRTAGITSEMPELTARLLPQPHGFEGGGLVRVGQHRADDLPLPQLIDVDLGDVDDRIARLAPASPARDTHDVVARLYVLLDLGPKIVEALPPFRQQRQESVGPLDRLWRVGRVGEVPELNIRVQPLCESDVVAAVEGGVSSSDDLHVLMGHSPTPAARRL